MSQKRSRNKVKDGRREAKKKERSKSRSHKQLAHMLLVEEIVKNEMEKASEPS
jgi:hypothetical protein